MGPTNTGKTSLAIELAKKLDAEIISVDSVQIYKHANIGSNKPKSNILDAYPHHLIDFLEPSDSYSVGSFRNDVIEIVNSLDSKKKNIILIGGTMMYFNALLNGISELPENNKKIRGLELTETLKNYAQTGSEYTKILNQIIIQNRLSDFEPVRLVNSVKQIELSS